MTGGGITRIEIYQDTQQEWRWRRIAANNEPIAQAGEGYVDKDHAVKMARSLFPGIQVFEIDVSETVPVVPEPVPPPEDAA